MSTYVPKRPPAGSRNLTAAAKPGTKVLCQLASFPGFTRALVQCERGTAGDETNTQSKGAGDDVSPETAVVSFPDQVNPRPQAYLTN